MSAALRQWLLPAALLNQLVCACHPQVERQLAALHNQLHVNVAPRKQALELLRHKIEEENRQVRRWGVAGRAADGLFVEGSRPCPCSRKRNASACSQQASPLCPTSPGSVQIDVHRAAHSKAKAAMDAAAAALAAAEQRKAKLSEELTMLVMQSSGAQMRVRRGGGWGSWCSMLWLLPAGWAGAQITQPFAGVWL